MASFQAYLDDSGTHKGAPWTVVGGAIGTKSSWQSLSHQWESVLRKFEVPEFHATDLQSFHESYEGWDESKRRAFTSCLLKIIKRERLCIIWSAVEQDLYLKISSEYPEFKMTPYQFCCEMCIQTIKFVAEKRKRVLPIEITFEAGQRVNSPYMLNLTLPEPLTIERRRAIGIRDLRFESSYIPPLQVADMVAYEFAKEFGRPKFGPRPARYSFYQLCSMDKRLSMGVLSDATHVRSHFEIMRKYWPATDWPRAQRPAMY